jgi:multidrug efflux pump subunit AcrA (membrane-fusion protein)
MKGIPARANSRPLLLALLIAAAGCGDKHIAPVETAPPSVMVANPLERQVTDYEIFTARTEAVQSVDVKARVTGYVTKITFTDGDLVKEGQPLFQIDERPYKAALDQAEGNLAAAKADLGAAKATLEISQATLVKTQAEYDIGLNVKKDNPGSISDQEIVRRQGARDEAKGSIDKAKASIAKGEASIKQAEADVEIARLNFGWCTVKAPCDGRTTRHLVSSGDLVTQNVTVLVNVVSLKPLWAYINVDQNTVLRVQALVKAGKLKSAREGTIPVGMSVGVGAAENFPIPGVIDFVNNQLDANTGTLQVRCAFDNEKEALVAGLFARIKVPVSEPHQALLVADQAVGSNQGQNYVLVVNDKDEIEYRAVDVGQVFDRLREVFRYRKIDEPSSDAGTQTRQVEVLKPGDRVVVMGQLRARPGDKVTPQAVDMQSLLKAPESK